MNRNLLKALAVLPSVWLLTGCIDDNYDLSNVDTTTRLNVTDLVLPVNIDPITLGDVIKLDEGSKIQSVNIGGKDFYALVEKGNFGSDPISISGVHAEASPLSPTHETLERLISEAGSRRNASSGEYVFPIKEMGNYFSYNSVNIDEAIVSLRHITTDPFEFKLNLEVEDEHSTISSMSFLDLVIRSPKGLDATPSVGTYDSATGLWRIPRVDVRGNHAEIALLATGVDTQTAKVSIRPDRSLDFNSEFHIQSGYIDITPNSMSFRDEVEFYIHYDLSDFSVKNFSGDVKYALDGIDIAPVSLSDIPDFLTGDETNVEIANPQIYLQINNPVAGIPLDLSAGLRLTAHRDGNGSRTFDLNDPLAIGHGLGVAGPYNFVMSPSDKNLNVPDEFAEGIHWNRFEDLGSLLAAAPNSGVKGLPESIDIDLVNAGIPVQSVNDFAVPCTFAAAKGSYELLAPLALNDGSKIIYSEIRDGWNDEDVDALTITRLEVTAHADNQCPVGVRLTVYPIDVNGNVIDATVESSYIPANSETDLTIILTGEVTHLDGIRYYAVLDAGENDEALSPAQTLNLTNIRARVSGYYQKEL